MQTFEQLNTQRSVHEAQILDLESQISCWKEQLSNPAMTAVNDIHELEIEVRGAESKISSVKHEIFVIDQDLAAIDRKQNSATLMAGYKETMQNWSMDKEELLNKRDALSARLEDIKTLVETKLTDARLAEETAARSYAQAVAWSDTQGEEAASAEAQKAGKALTAAQEYERRQELMINALRQELKIVDEHVEEADREFAKAQKSAVWLATERLQEEWDAASERLIAIGAKLYAGKSHMGWEIMAFYKLHIDSEVHKFKSWTNRDLMQMSHEFTLEQVIEVQSPTPYPIDKAA